LIPRRRGRINAGSMEVGSADAADVRGSLSAELIVPAYRFIVEGRVQGVGYRYFVLRQAEALGVAGFARNLPDGTVEVVAEGTDEAVGALEDRLRLGPSFAAVGTVGREAIAPRGDRGFHIR
jgi:acylphosphatase